LLVRAHELLPHPGHELRDLALHLLHLPAHVEDDLHPGQVHSEVAREVQDDLELPEVGLRVEARVAFGARRLQQTLALGEAQGLGVDAGALGDDADHVVLARGGRGARLAAAAASPGHYSSASGERTSWGCSRASSCSRARPRSSVTAGITTR